MSLQLSSSILPLPRLAWLLGGTFLGLLMAVGLFALLPQTAQAAGTIFYVSPAGDDANACSNSAQPCRTLQRAINVAGADDIIRIAAGVYTSTGAEVALISFPLAVSGGWDTTFAAQTGGSSIVDGENLRRGLTIAANAATRLETLIIQNGAASEGGGMWAGANSPLTLVNVQLLTNTAVLTGGGLHALGSVSVSEGRFENNQCTDAYCAGGGLYTGGSLAVTSTQFISNTAQSRGGGAFATGPVAATGGLFQNNAISGTFLITDTTNGFGGGLFGAGQVTLTGTQFLSNTARFTGGVFITVDAFVSNALFQRNVCLADNCYGGGINVHGDAIVTDTQFISNTAPGRGGGLDVFGETTLVGGLFQGNDSAYGGGVFVDDTVTLSGTQFLSNTARFEGGGVAAFGTLAATNVTFRYNQALRGGGATCGQGITLVNSVFEYNAATLTEGGGLVCRIATASRIANSIFHGNSARTSGGGIFLVPDAGLLIERSRLTDNVAQDVEGGGLFISGEITTTNSVSLDNNFIAANRAAFGAAELGLGGTQPVSIIGRHNTFSAQTAGNGTAVRAGAAVSGQVLSLTNSIFDGYAIGVQTGAETLTATLNGVLWSGVTTPTVAGVSPITVTAAYTGGAQFVNAAARDYHILRTSEALNRGVATALTTDIDGGRRVQGGQPDLGADENDFFTNLAIGKRVTPVLVTPGALITFTLTFTNTGPDFAAGTLITDLVPSQYLSGTAFSAQGVTVTPTAGVTYTWQVSNLAANATGVITLTGTVRNDLTTAATFTNTAALANPDDTSPNNNVASTSVNIVIPISGLSAVSNSPRQLGAATQFTATVAAGSNVSFLWNFGDGTTGSGATPPHVYGAIGAYTAVVTASNLVNSVTTTVPVQITDVPISGLSANSSGPTQLGHATVFTGVIAAGSNVNYTWNFGDGAMGSGLTTSHTYPAVGTYIALLTATNSANTLTATVAVQVDTPINGLNLAGPDVALTGATQVYTATVTDGSRVIYAWTVNGLVAGSLNPLTYAFPEPGIYTVTVTATNSLGTQQQSKVVTVAGDYRVFLPLIQR